MSIIYDWKNNILEEQLSNVIYTLQNNGIGILPTETVYGLAANAFSDEACKKIFIAKGRAQDNPLIVHVSDKKMIYNLVETPSSIEEKLIDSFMPGPFTLILKKKNSICNTVTCGNNTVGIRMPTNKIINAVIAKSQIPLAAPSANISGKPSGTCVSDIKDEFFDKVDFIVDGGKCNIGIESTVAKVENNIPIILRPGFITEDDIRNAVGSVRLSDKLFRLVNPGEIVESPGMKYKHYAPDAKCVLVLPCENQVEKLNALISEYPNSCVLGFREDESYINVSRNRFICLGSKYNLQEISSNIFSSLRKIDNLGFSFAIIQGLEKKNLGLSIMNRLVRACENNII